MGRESSLGSDSRVVVDLLGPLELWVAGKRVSVGSGRLRSLLAALAISPNRSVSVDRLIDAVWGEETPSRPKAALQNCVFLLRRMLGQSPARIAISGGGYLIELADGNVDLGRFRSLTGSVAPGGDLASESRRLAEAGRLWRGTPLSDVPSDLLHREVVPRIVEEYLAAVERRIDIDLSLNRQADLVTELVGLTIEHPFRERFWAQLMTAQYRLGRQAAALETFEAVRSHLDAELGALPGKELCDVRDAVLAGDAAPVPSQAVTRVPAVDMLPRGVPDLVGRAAEIHRLTSMFEESDVATAVVLDGMAGAGKTALAVTVAHRLKSRFPDGTLYVDLRGQVAGRPPLTPEAALAVMLRALGVEPAKDADVSEHAARFRAALAGRRILVVLDDAADEGQVIPLLPGSPGCAGLVTSRRRLRRLADVAGLTVDPLVACEAAELFVRAVGADRPVEPGLAREVALCCGRLPLAIRLAAARLRHRPMWTVRDLLARIGDVPDGLAAAFASSADRLAEAEQRMFGLLGLFADPEFDTQTAAAIVDLPVDEAERLLEGLLDAHLLEQSTAECYRFHDLVRAYARQRGLAECTEDDRGRAADRIK